MKPATAARPAGAAVEGSDGGAPPANPATFRTTAPAYIFVFLGVIAVALMVHYSAIAVDRTDLPLAEMENAITARCEQLISAGLAGAGSANSPPPSILEVAVWVDSAHLLPSVHDALDAVQAALSRTKWREQDDGVVVQRVVQLSAAAPASGTGEGDLAASVVWQQLGLKTLQHVSSTSAKKAMDVYGISLIANRTGAAGAREPRSPDGTQCMEFAHQQAYCTVAAPEEPSTALRGEVRAAIATLLARWWGIPSFVNETEVANWYERRQAQGCLYTLRALRALQVVVDAHPTMAIPETLHSEVFELWEAIRSHSFASAAHIARKLQFHPLLVPQVYLPWDHLFVTQMMILFVPVLSMFIGLKHVGRELKRLRQRRRQAAAAAAPDAGGLRAKRE